MDMKKIKGIVPLSSMQGDGPDDTRLLRKMYSDAERFLASFPWCQQIKRSFFGFGVGGVVAVFLFEIDPRQARLDRSLWVIVGDLPPAYLVTDRSPTPKAALRTYVDEMRHWIRYVRQGKSVETSIPVNVPATKVWARRLEKRLDFLESEILRR